MRRLSTFPATLTQLDLFVSAGGDIATRDAQDLMAWPFFSLAKPNG
jgi:plasmid replication initiation protein